LPWLAGLLSYISAQERPGLSTSNPYLVQVAFCSVAITDELNNTSAMIV